MLADKFFTWVAWPAREKQKVQLRLGPARLQRRPARRTAQDIADAGAMGLYEEDVAR